ncbi:MAG: family 20 glycosylhydrolase [Planctomycetota bacterium]|nr:family 20 glycosylhydrolase [Planctomycetota bacterium]
MRVDDPKSVALVRTMLEELLEAHPRGKYFHLGMDEAWALVDTAKRLKRDVLDVYLDHLRVLVPIVEAHGKKPIIWTDMLEDHFRPDAFAEFKERVVFATWDYGTIPAKGGWPNARLSGGTRVSREWLEDPADTRGPGIGAGTKFVEDLPAKLRKVVEPHREGRLFTPLFQADMWRGLGAEVLPVSALRVSSHLSVLPAYHEFFANIRGISRAVHRAGCLGQIGTSWARGTSWCPPNFPIDLTWPLIAELSRSLGGKPKPFFAGVPAKTVDRLILTLGRSRRDWRLELKVAEEMEALAPHVKSHRYEWLGIALMARALDLQRKAEFNLAEVDYFFPNHRPVDSEWQRRLDEQAATLREIAALRKRIIAHFGKRYHGKAFDEWVGQVFGVLEQRIKDVTKICRAKKALARKTYARKR